MHIPISLIHCFQVIADLELEYPGVYTMDNVILSGTHTHSGPAGYNQYLLLGITCLGYVDEAFVGLVTGITQVLEKKPDAYLNERFT